jgi:hypothetical protein
MEDKRGTKRSRSLSKEGSPSPSDTKTPPLAPSESPPLPGSLSEISSRRPCSTVFEQGGSGKALVIDLSSSSDEDDLIADTSHDFEFAQRLYDELNRAALGPPSDGKIIILSDSEEGEVREEKNTGTKDAVASAVVNPASIAPPTPTMPLWGQKTIIVMIRPLIRRLAVTTAAEVTPVSLRLPRQEGAEVGVLQEELQWFCIAILSSLYVDKLG